MLIALAPVIHQGLPRRLWTATLPRRPVRSLLLMDFLASSALHVLPGLAHVPLSAVYLSTRATVPLAERAIVALAEIFFASVVLCPIKAAPPVARF
ncbi:MAG TPA: hypothetical protein VFB23_00805 [Candidatus Acidoferrales bacterium]|jgi:hypothetical protein|nr:hypothetical protein [Candidatus Acidoferrales bacterium]